MSLLPHRYPFLLVDRVLELVPGKRVVGIKNVSINEPFFRGHWPGMPIMPGVLVVEALAQAAGVLIAASIRREGKLALIAAIDGIKLRRPIVPGDQVLLEVVSNRIKDHSAVVTGTAKVGGLPGGRGPDPIRDRRRARRAAGGTCEPADDGPGGRGMIPTFDPARELGVPAGRWPAPPAPLLNRSGGTERTWRP